MAKNYAQEIQQLVDHLDGWFTFPVSQTYARMTNKLFPYTQLFSPIQINGLWIKNRIVMGPMGNISMSEEMGRPSQKMIDYFVDRAKGGVGLITTGLVPVSQGIDPTLTEPGDRSYFPRIDRSRTVFAGWRTLAESLHAYGARIFIQLSSGLGRVGSPEVLVKKWALPVSASWNPNYYMPEVPCRPLTDWECWQIIQRMGQAAADAKEMLIDGAYLHGHEGYLLEQMTNPAYNRRKLSQFSDWQRFGLETVKEMRRRVGTRYPIMYRIDLTLALNAVYGERMNRVPALRKFRDERTVEMTLDYMKNLVREGVDLFDVDLGSYDNWWLPHPPNSMPSGCYLAVARIVKEYFEEHNILSNVGLPVPVVGVGKLGYPDLAEKALRDNLCDMVMLARPLLADPAWPNKAYAGRVEEITPCIGDQEACLNEFLEGGHPQCSVNPRSGFEHIIPVELVATPHPKKIAVVGAGPAGILCAVTAAQRGHLVTLFEKADQIGGMLVPGSVPRIKYEVLNYRLYLEKLVERTIRDHALILQLKTEVNMTALRKGAFDAVIVAVGGKRASLRVSGADLPHVYHALDIFTHPEILNGRDRVVVVGGGSVGCECAHFLSFEHAKQVTIIEVLPNFMKGVCTANRTHLIRTLEQNGVQLLNSTRLKQVTAEKITVLRNISPTVPNPLVTWAPLLPENVPNPLAKPLREELVEVDIPADAVVLANGLNPAPEFYEECLREHVAAEIISIGDAFEVKRVFEAVKAGFAVGRSI